VASYPARTWQRRSTSSPGRTAPHLIRGKPGFFCCLELSHATGEIDALLCSVPPSRLARVRCAFCSAATRAANSPLFVGTLCRRVPPKSNGSELAQREVEILDAWPLLPIAP